MRRIPGRLAGTAWSLLGAAWCSEDRGAAALEYALLVAMIAIAIITATAAFGAGVRDTFCAATTALGFTSSC